MNSIELFASIEQTSYSNIQRPVIMDTIIHNFFGEESAIYLYTSKGNSSNQFDQTIYLIVYTLPVNYRGQSCSVGLNIYLTPRFPSETPEIFFQSNRSKVINPYYSAVIINHYTLQFNHHILHSWNPNNTDFTQLFNIMKSMFRFNLPLNTSSTELSYFTGQSGVDVSKLTRVVILCDNYNESNHKEQAQGNNDNKDHNNKVDLIPTTYANPTAKKKGIFDDFVIIEKEDIDMNNKKDTGNKTNDKPKNDTKINYSQIIGNRSVIVPTENKSKSFIDVNENNTKPSIAEVKPVIEKMTQSVIVNPSYRASYIEQKQKDNNSLQVPVPVNKRLKPNKAELTVADVNDILLDEIKSRLPSILSIQMTELSNTRDQLKSMKESYIKKIHYDEDMVLLMKTLHEFDLHKEKLKNSCLSLSNELELSSIFPHNEVSFDNINALVTITTYKSLKFICMENTLEEFLVKLRKAVEKGRIPFEEAMKYTRAYSRELYNIKQLKDIALNEGL